MRSTGKKKVTKKNNRRANTKNPNLNPTYNLKSRTKLLDQDYIEDLSEKEKRWLNKFNGEFIGAGNLNSKHKPLHRTRELKKDCYDRNNSRNRDILTKQEAMGVLKNLDDQLKVSLNPMDNLELFLDLRAQGYIDDNGEFTVTLEDFEDGEE